MKHLTTLALILHSSLFILHSASAAVPLKWTVETSRVQPATFDEFAGATYDLEATLQSYGRPLEVVGEPRLYWQTNGMASAWWSAPATVSGNVLRATWTPACDVGARAYNCFIGITGTVYNAAFQLRLRPSPGAVPNEMPLPQKVIDFSQVTVLNPPWPAGDARPLPHYLHELSFDDTYPDDAAWYYALPHDYSSCSAVRDGGFLYRNYDWRLDDAAEFVVRVSAGPGRFASVGVANCGTNLTERIVTSGRWSRFYRCLPGRTVDGINENGVACEVNVVGGDPHDRWPTNGTIHCMGAVRWVLDHATDAGMAASNLVEHLYFPDGFSQNFHWMIADETSTYVVENGECSNVTGRAVMTNFPLLPTPGEGAGRERYELLLSSACCITNAWYTRAYSRDTEWVSEFHDPAEMEAAKSAWETYGRDALRGKGLWQTVHTSVYDIENRTLRVAVQERPDWYTFAVPGGTGVSPVQIREIVQPMIADATNYTDRATGEVVRLVGDLASSVSSLESSKRDKTDLAVYTNGFTEWVVDPSSDYITDIRYFTDLEELYAAYPEIIYGNIPGWHGNFYGSGIYLGSTNEYETTLNFTANFPDVRIVAHRQPTITPTTDTLATTSDLSNSVQRVERQLDDKADSADLAPLSIGYQRLYSFQTSATNVNISVTNYPPTAEEAEGRTHFDPTAPDPDLDFSTVPASLRVDETRGGKRTVVDTRDWPFWFFTSKLPGILAAAREYAREAYTNALVSLAAWASRTATGAENPAGDSTLVVDVPNIWLMTDQTFEKHVAGSNSCWVIRSKNAAVSPGVATNGFLELTDAFGAPYIRFNKTEATFADPPADGISYDADAGEWLISYSTEAQPRGGANIALQGSTDYPGKAILKEADDPLCPAVITWSGSARNWVMHARPKRIGGIDPDRMFFGAVVEIEGQDYIEYLKPVSFSHIVLPNGKKIAPDVPQSATVGSTVTWKVVL